MIEMCGRKVHPVIVAPMAAVTDENNYKVWLDNNFICVVPRTVDFEKRLEICKETFCSFSLDEAQSIYLESKIVDLFINKEKFYVCVDIAQGTMNRLYEICKKLKFFYGDKIEIMTGNVATPEAYDYYADAEIDYMRLSIGTGSRCTTSCNVGIHYPVATLIDDIATKKKEWDMYYGKGKPSTKIIVDGGISNFDDIQKCLALGAFAVMNGSSFAKAEEACGEVRYLTMTDSFEGGMPSEEYKEAKANSMSGTYYLTNRELHYLSHGKPFREYYGMSTKRAQKECGNVCSKTSEGIVKLVEVEYPIAKWADNMKSYIASAMSYCDAKTIDEFRIKTDLIINLSGDKQFRK
jgi:IMP dehydrogenase/GMP reductase